MTDQNDSTDALINDLVADLEPAERPGRFGRAAVIWLAGSFIAAAALMLLRAPFRAGSGTQLLEHPQFFVESAFGIAAIAIVTIAAFRTSIPGAATTLRTIALGIGALIVWIGFYLYGYHEPALPPSMAGKREFCEYEVFLVGLPLLFGGCWLLRRNYVLNPVATGLLVGLAAGAVPGLMMQFACMYLPHHILTHHILPVVALGALAACVAPWLRLKPPS